MNIGLIDIEPKVFNTAYMQIAAHFRGRGDSVDWWLPLTDGQFDHVFCSSLFDYTDKTEVPKRAIRGGTGFDITSRLSQAIEACDYDYSIYPECDKSIVWFSRGCIHKCPFCCVWQKEGYIRAVKPKNLNPNGKYVVVQDGNFFANPQWKTAIEMLLIWGQPVSFNAGIDARIITKEQCDALNRVKRHKQIYTAWDNPKDDLVPRLRLMTSYITPSRIACYVLIGYWSTPEEDLYRVETLRELGIDPFVMPYDRSDLYQRAFARWVNHKAIFKTVTWPDYWQGVRESENVECTT